MKETIKTPSNNESNSNEQEQQEKRKRDRKSDTFERSRRFSLTFVIVVLGLAMVCIIALDWYSVVSILHAPSGGTALSAAEKVESTILASGIAIIGIAIAVWAGLNIIQVLEKGMFDDLQNKVKADADEINEKINEELESSSKEHSRFQKERRSKYRTDFITYLAQSKDRLNLYLANEFKAISEFEGDAELYLELNEIEHYFRTVYQNHADKIRLDETQLKLITENAKEVSKKIEELHQVSSEEVRRSLSLFTRYLDLRIAESKYYYGYEPTDQKVALFEDAAKRYLKSFPKLKEPEKYASGELFLDGNVIFTGYMLNTVGDCYCNMLKQMVYQEGSTKFQETEKNALRYYQTLEEFMCRFKKNPHVYQEVYYRNYGCALEHIITGYRTKPDKQAEAIQKYGPKLKEVYEKSVQLNLLDTRHEANSFYTYVSLFHKTMNLYLNLQDKTAEDGEAYSDFADCDSLWKESEISKEKMDALKTYAEQAEVYADFAVSAFADRLVFFKHRAFIKRDLYCLYRYFDQVEAAVDKLKEFCMYAEELRKMYPNGSEWDRFAFEIDAQSKTLQNFRN